MVLLETTPPRKQPRMDGPAVSFFSWHLLHDAEDTITDLGTPRWAQKLVINRGVKEIRLQKIFFFGEPNKIPFTASKFKSELPLKK